jgi:hypothetical protein
MKRSTIVAGLFLSLKTKTKKHAKLKRH